jgi:dTDP-4-dehydrorhamnose reductase
MILVVGGTSFIGATLIHQARDQGQEISCTSRRPGADIPLDLMDDPREWKIPSNIQHAIFCAAVTGIANCENSPEATRSVNVEAVKELSLRLSDLGAKITYLSSNLVFSPDTSAPSESGALSPATEYGRQKLAVEEFLLCKIPDSQIIRPTKVVSPSLPLFSKWKHAILAQQPFEAFTDLYLSPISIKAVAEWILKIALGKDHGIFHLSASDSISYAEAGKWLLKRLGADASLLIPTCAPNPNTPDSCRLNCSRTSALTGFQPIGSFQNLEESWV